MILMEVYKMLLKFKDNRVRRSYSASGIINKYTSEMPKNYPEDWIASVVEAFNPNFEEVKNEGLSTFENGEVFKEYIEKNPDVLGEKTDISILVKFLDAGERLVIQCHPTDDFAKEYFNSPYGKTECWYMVDTTPDACVYLGFNETATRQKWEKAFQEQDKISMLSMLHKFSVKKGDCILVKGGVPHAIGAGCFMVELQQPTDLMVIPEKTTESGMVLNERKLHGGLGFDKMFDCFEYNALSKDDTKNKFFINHNKKINEVVSVINEDSTDKFALDVIYVQNAFELLPQINYSVFVVIDGSGEIFDGVNKYSVKSGDKFFVEANTKIKILTEETLNACILKP